MKWLGYLLSVLISIVLIFLTPFMKGPMIFLVALYAGLFVYWAFRPTWDDRIPAVKKIAIAGTILTVLLIIESILLRNLANKAQALGPGIILMFNTPSIAFVIGLGLIFVGVPALLAFLDGLTKPDQEGMIRNPILVFFYVILTLGIYEIYWFWLIKKGLRYQHIETKSLWWFLLPIVGAIILYIDFSKALEKRTQRKFVTWFLIFFFCSGIDIVINQAIINHDLNKIKE